MKVEPTHIPGLHDTRSISSRLACEFQLAYYFVYIAYRWRAVMSSTTFTVRVNTGVKKRLERLAKSTGRSRSFLAAEAISDYLEVNEWQVAGIKQAIASLDRGEAVPHEAVKDWVASWSTSTERTTPKRR